MSEIKSMKNFFGSSSLKKIKISKNGKIIKEDLKRPQAPFFIFCSVQRKKIISNGKGTNLTVKELGEQWKNLPESKKQIYKDKYKSDKFKYEKARNLQKSKKNTFIETEENISNNKVKAIPDKDSIYKNNSKSCNCGICLVCQKRKEKNKEEDLNDKVIISI